MPASPDVGSTDPIEPPGQPLDATRQRAPRVTLFGLDFVDAADIETVATEARAFETSDGEVLPLVVTPNVDHLVQFETADRVVLDATRRAAFVLPDGQPLIWASKLFGESLGGRLTGSDLFASLIGGGLGADALVIAPSTEVVDGLADRHPEVRAVVAPMLDVGDRAAGHQFAKQVVSDLAEPLPRHVFVCISQPKQVFLALDILAAWPAEHELPLCYCVGAAAEMYLGLEKRAPGWMQRGGLEFVYRAALNPRRLVRRYAHDATRFPVLVAREWRRRRNTR